MNLIRSNSCLAAIFQYKLTPCLIIYMNFDFDDEFRPQTERGPPFWTKLSTDFAEIQ